MTIEISPPTQLVLIGLVAVTTASLFLRTIVFFRREKRGVRSTYPSAWTMTQCRAIEQFRLLVGLGLLSLWGTFFFIAPAIETSRANHVVIAFVVLLLLISNAWLLLILPRSWERFGAVSRSFSVAMTFLLIWWGITFTATGWLLAKAAATPRLHTISGVYAAGGSALEGTAFTKGRRHILLSRADSLIQKPAKHCSRAGTHSPSGVALSA
jgi:hypothetical protein